MIKNEKLTFMKFVTLIARYRNSILVNLIVVGVISLTFSLLLPKWYKATAIVMPPPQETGAASFLSSSPLSMLGLNFGANDEATYMAILKSRSLADEIIEKYYLMEFYEKKTMFETYQSFYNDFEVMFTEENMISISYEFKDSVKVAEIVNYIVKRLGKISNKLILQRAKRNKKVLEQRYLKNLRDIDSLQLKLKLFQQNYGILEFYSQTKAIISSIVDLEEQEILKIADLNAIGENYGKNSPQYKFANIQYAALKKQIDKLRYSNQKEINKPFSSLFIPLEEMPELGEKYTVLYTNLLLQKKLQEFLLPQYEQAKLQLLKKHPALQVIDNATPPDYKSKPKRALIVLGSLIIAFMFQLVVLIFIERMQIIKNLNQEKYSEIRYVMNRLLFWKSK